MPHKIPEAIQRAVRQRAEQSTHIILAKDASIERTDFVVIVGLPIALIVRRYSKYNR